MQLLTTFDCIRQMYHSLFYNIQQWKRIENKNCSISLSLLIEYTTYYKLILNVKGIHPFAGEYEIP